MQEFSHPPLIGISGSSAESVSVQAMMTQIRSAGGVPVFLCDHAQRDPQKDSEKLDAVVIMGNDYDLHPQDYGQKRHIKTEPLTENDSAAARCAYEKGLITAAIEKKQPLLGVCGGMQLINVVSGGASIHQHIPDLGVLGHKQSKFAVPHFIPVHPVNVVDGTELAEIHSHGTHYFQAEDVVLENSDHHQAIEKVGDGLRASAYSGEGDKKIIEAVEVDPHGKLAGQFILGMQWHPEFGASDLGAKIAERLSQKAAAYATEHHAQRSPQQVYALSMDESTHSIAACNDCPSVKVTVAQKLGEVMDMVRRCCTVGGA